MRRVTFAGAATAGLAMLLTGCHGIGYYAQAVRGHLQIVSQARPIREILDDQRTPAGLKEKLELVLDLREFAERELRLPANGHYLRYADIGRRFAVWNVYAAPEFSLEAKTWWYPFAGGLKYHGYFAEANARRYAARLQRQGYDVYVGGVQAYSTLGWFRDPVLSTFIHESETELADLLFHELAHQRLFVPGDTDFNEAFATAVAEAGVRRWLAARGDSSALREYEAELQCNARFVALVEQARTELAALYTTPPRRRGTEHLKGAEILAARSAPSDPSRIDAQRQAKAQIIERLRGNLEQFADSQRECAHYAGWFRHPVNNAKINDVDTYYRLVPAFLRLLETQGSDLEAFYREVQTIARLAKAERHQRLDEALATVRPDSEESNASVAEQ